MNPSSRLRPLYPFLALGLGCAAALLGCMDTQVAGSSVTTGNPTEIQVGFTEGGASTAFTGRMALFGASQIPVPGFRPAPLDSWEVSGASEARLTAQDLADIPDSLWPAGSTVGDSLRLFNLVVTGGSKGTITRELAYRIKTKEFALKEGSFTAEGKAGVARIAAALVPLVRHRAQFDPESLESWRENYLFLPGTGFLSKGDRGTFEFPPLPEGQHALAFLSVPMKGGISLPEDSVNVYTTDLPLTTGKVDTVATSGIRIRLPMPEEYQGK